jgi:hypothetical protein
VKALFLPWSEPRQLRQWVSLAIVLSILSACATGFHVEPADTETYPTTAAVDWLDHEPDRPYVIVARFQGTELGWCRSAEPYCSLRKQATRLGANAIWIQRRYRHVRPDVWVDIQGKMTRIPESFSESIEGVLIRYR